MGIVGGFDIHRRQITVDYLDTDTGETIRGKIAPADRQQLRSWLGRFAGRSDVAFALEGCTGWRFVAEELARAGSEAHLAEPADTAKERGRKQRAKTDRSDARLQRELLGERAAARVVDPPGPRARGPGPGAGCTRTWPTSSGGGRGASGPPCSTKGSPPSPATSSTPTARPIWSGPS